jgi:hypothetical protein
MPPTVPAISPESNGAPEASEMPKHNGTATKNTTIEAGRSYFMLDRNELESSGFMNKINLTVHRFYEAACLIY